jgi:glutamate racemase
MPARFASNLADAPIGVFDSGLGGLTVVHALLERCPAERIVYLGDTARVPYGTRSKETVIRYASRCAAVLMNAGIKALVVACNTVSAVALDMLRVEFDLPVLGVIEPGARAALEAMRTRSSEARAYPIGILGTQGTIASGAYPQAVARLSTRFEVYGQAAPLLVPLVEEGWLSGDVPELAVTRYVAPLIDAGVRVIVLGCTHYPLLKDTIERVATRLAGEPVAIVDSAHATAEELASWLSAARITPARLAPPGERLELLVTDLPASFQAAAERFLGRGVPEARQIDLSIEQ